MLNDTLKLPAHLILPDTKIFNPFKTVESLHKYESSPGQAQRFLGKTQSSLNNVQTIHIYMVVF